MDQLHPDPSAAAFLKNLTGRPACLILDQDMTQMTGLELVARLRGGGMHVPVLLMTELARLRGFAPLKSDFQPGASR